MSIEILPTEILIQVLDDASLEIGDLAVISRVSHRWYSAVVPVLYKRFTFRYSHSLKEEDLKRLESFKKHGHHVKHLSLHIKDWRDESDSDFDSDSESESSCITDTGAYLGILGSFNEVTHIEHYDIDIRAITWPVFWTILNYLVSAKRKLISLTIRRGIHWNIQPCSDHDINPEKLLPTPRLPNLTSFSFQVKNRRSGPDSIGSFPSFRNNLVLALGESCRSVSNLQLHIKIFEAPDTEKSIDLWNTDLPLIPVDNVKELKYVLLPGLIPPPRLLGTGFEDTRVLTTASWVCGRWLNWAWEQIPPGKSLNYFGNLETLRITDTLQTGGSGEFEKNLELVTRHLPKLESLILEDDERQFSISRKPDGSPIWKEVSFVV
ncbi:hypothetical protein TWF481_003660 [Arthrobotrys musiformis]|uniref:F-box domain-containing protein n=1 Tax=Arthrobotrys musiformis TaxID=47236 RepID=A0AAV9WHA0_9PEZI